MNLSNYDKAIHIIKSNKEIGYFAGPRPINLLSKAEYALGLSFPASYSKFIEEFGAGNFGAFEIYGLINDNFEESSVPDAIWYTITERNETSIPKTYIIIGESGEGTLYCIDTKIVDENGESPIVTYSPGYELNEQNTETIAHDFGEYLFNFVKEQI